LVFCTIFLACCCAKYDITPTTSIHTSSTVQHHQQRRDNKQRQQEEADATYDKILQAPFVTTELYFHVIWIVIPYALAKAGGNIKSEKTQEQAKETVRNYLSKVNAIQPIPRDGSYWNRLIHLIIERHIIEHRLTGKLIWPISMSVLRRENRKLHGQIIAATLSKETDRVDELAAMMPTGDD